jgi:hypothetical protein
MRISDKLISAAFAMSLLTPAGILFAQDPNQAPPQSTPAPNPPTGGWRRVTDLPPGQQSAPDASATQSQWPDDSGQAPQAPPPGYQNPSNYPAQGQPGPQGQPAYAPQGQPAYGQQGQPGYGPQGQPGYGQQGQPGYGPQGQPGYGQQGQPGYPQNQNNMPAPPPVPAQLTIKPGTYVTVRVNQPLSSDKNQVGDAFTATLAQPVVVDGVVVAQRGQTIYGHVTEAKKAGRVEGTSRLGVQLTQLTLVDGQQLPIQSQMISRNGPTSIGRDAAAIGGTTALGAAVGAAAGWGRGAAIGAGAGAVVGTLGVLLTRGQPTILYPESVLTFRIEQPVTVATDHAPDAFRYVDPYDYNGPPSYQARPMGPMGPGGPAPYGYAGAPAPYYYGYAAPYPYYYAPFGFYFGPRAYYGGLYIGRGGYYRGWRR